FVPGPPPRRRGAARLARPARAARRRRPRRAARGALGRGRPPLAGPRGGGARVGDLLGAVHRRVPRPAPAPPGLGSGAGAARIGGPPAARPIHPGSGRARVVRANAARPHPPPDAGALAPGNRASLHGGRAPVPLPLAARPPGHAGARRARPVGSARAAARTPGGGRAAAELEAGLWELVSAGLASSDGFAAVRFLTSPHRRTPASGHPLSGAGRWSLLRPPSEEAAEPRTSGDAPAWLESLARQYLRRYGLVFRDLLAREPRCPPWRELARLYRRMEARGELRGGRFAQAFSGEQFALPEALDALRSVRRTRPAGTERVQVSSADPLNLVGILTPGPRGPVQSGLRIR